jgi:hypothetical protein
MSFLVFLLILAFLTLFTAVSIQIRHMALKGKKPWGHAPVFLAVKLSENAYGWACAAIGWILVILGAQIYNLSAIKPGGPFWCSAYLGALAVLYVLLWIKNRSLDLRP